MNENGQFWNGGFETSGERRRHRRKMEAFYERVNEWRRKERQEFYRQNPRENLGAKGDLDRWVIALSEGTDEEIQGSVQKATKLKIWERINSAEQMERYWRRILERSPDLKKYKVEIVDWETVTGDDLISFLLKRLGLFGQASHRSACWKKLSGKEWTDLILISKGLSAPTEKRVIALFKAHKGYMRLNPDDWNRLRLARGDVKDLQSNSPLKQKKRKEDTRSSFLSPPP